MGFVIGFAVGVFLAIGSAYVLRRTMALLDEKIEKWNPGQAVGIASLWVTKLVGACLVLYLAQRAGFSTPQLGVGLPVGIVIGVLISRRKLK